MFQIQYITDIVTRLEHSVDIILGVRCAEAEPHTSRNKRGSGVSDDNDDDGCSAVLHHAMEHGEFSGVEDEQRHNGRRRMAVGDEAELLQCACEVAAVECKTAETFVAL